MRLLKDKSYKYISFYDSLQALPAEQSERQAAPFMANPQPESAAGSLLEKYFHMVQNIMAFEKQISALQDMTAVTSLLKLYLKRVVPLKEANLFYFNESRSNLFSFDGDIENQFTIMINSVYKEGILDWVFENAKPVVIPEVNNYTVSGPKLNYIFFPVIEDQKRKGLLAILTTLSKSDFTDFENQSIQMILNACLSKVDKIELKEKLNRTYSELQTYQAKLSNDFRLSAIGELTEGIVEDIKSPLQVILSCADLSGKDESDAQTALKIKEQVKKINYVINRLVKFSNINEEKIKIHPCNLNDIITEYYNLVKSSLENANIECVLDFEHDIPPVLSNPSYVFQLLSNIMSMIKSGSSNGGGVIIQTRCVSESILIKVINTTNIDSIHPKTNTLSKSSDLNMKIVENIMKKHEGMIKVESFQKNSSIVVLRFPLRRKFR